jgi:hypothetical protein
MEFMIIALYMLPTLFAMARSHANTTPIFIVNLFFGWTILGWIVCLAWAFSAQEKKAN